MSIKRSTQPFSGAQNSNRKKEREDHISLQKPDMAILHHQNPPYQPRILNQAKNRGKSSKISQKDRKCLLNDHGLHLLHLQLRILGSRTHWNRPIRLHAQNGSDDQAHQQDEIDERQLRRLPPRVHGSRRAQFRQTLRAQ